ncbi:NAD-dependent succinate-semialdehyde dehydrogenase [Arthrobacter sp. FW306-07-I]|uniref:NAD-dependent succinate-semialdehyde dehydrogenase n=1 Tax=Arthrobacter sp. FW306-07-I TaxID=2879622 RepID=UPI001F457303|nr:NAD-dependent succinate-semialdehyde dehydrogenase [Arthrobacter sp. FW306-07-I]UKA76185.1 NAD-dependent succinate-semialdehyde dehydrogenase [Arthrobacter sp. FW306-07-I]
MTAIATSLQNTDLWIGGHYVPGANDQIPVLNPSTGETIATVANADEKQATNAVDAAAAALPAWKALAPRERAEILRRCFEQMTRRAEEIAQLISTENGKTLADARGETAYAAEFFRWYSEEAVRARGHISVSPSGKNRILAQYEPIGVAVLVTPWNFPAAMATRKIAPALAAGCTVVLKPATETPLTAYLIAECCRDAGVPEGVVNVVTTRKSGPVVSAMLHDDRVRALSFTGSTEVGRTLLHESADNVLKTSMELGGNAPFLVFDDADLDEAVEGLMVAKMRNGGQACTAANRIYAHRSIADELGRKLASRMGELAMGAGTDPSSGCGPLINADAVSKVDALVSEAVGDGAEILLGATLPKGQGYFYPPTVLAGVQASSRIVREEIFGPVASIIAFDTDTEAIDAANSTVLGLSAYIYTKDLQRGLTIAEQIESGMIAINQGLLSDPAAPFGGVKQSGLGREGSQDGMLEFMETKYIATKW